MRLNKCDKVRRQRTAPVRSNASTRAGRLRVRSSSCHREIRTSTPFTSGPLRSGKWSPPAAGAKRSLLPRTFPRVGPRGEHDRRRGVPP